MAEYSIRATDLTSQIYDLVRFPSVVNLGGRSDLIDLREFNVLVDSVGLLGVGDSIGCLGWIGLIDLTGYLVRLI